MSPNEQEQRIIFDVLDNWMNRTPWEKIALLEQVISRLRAEIAIQEED